MAPKIDHIIIKVPYSELTHPSEWLTRNFTISPGGRHADNKTENRLIVFRDGSYIELIAFINDDQTLMHGHWWGTQPFGIVDWALTSSAPEDVHAVAQHIEAANPGGLGAGYDDAVAGGRRRPDGAELQWDVTFPHGVKRGEVPFWCHDRTPRALRVPVDDVPKTTHPCGALGVGELTVAVSRNRYDAFTKLYSAILGFAPLPSSVAFGASWEVDSVYRQDGNLPKPLVTMESSDTAEHACVSEITLLTDSIGLGQSRTTLLEKLGGSDIVVHFIHGRRAVEADS
ncbi:hypothetical protein EJ05DRAFT_477697 [Pseudovirgaria hyperparasitica]|uniref:Glyoxalase-like domain-containing protein n=1 Tax=Pseudovirgaria hyperparasitica TaxID=470096 RepID=A0A6A6W4U3_9PEZI|nr:uncharacterized protein EJ05DRAFT_477697 [Pseudovirgaria hyperparasitica]KAF2756577.1 hypothetical protein EJ05DRAFT_477697 [Pseudovirgaria hyperparasitica]